MFHRFPGACLLLSIASIGGCSNSDPNPPQKIYDLKGTVVSVDIPARTIKIDHQEIPGLMKAMTMSFPIESDQLKEFGDFIAGDAVEGKLKIVGSKYVLTDLHKTKSTASNADESLDEGADINKNLAKLSDEDRKLAKAQRLCPIGGEELGSMGAPIKLMVKDQPVFICCKGCKSAVEKDPDGTLKKVADLGKKKKD